MTTYGVSSYSSPPLTATTAPTQTIPTPPTTESEIVKSYSVPSREELAISMPSNMMSQMAMPEGNSTSSSMLSRRQNASLPPFTLPASSNRSFSYGALGTSATTPSLLTPPVLGNEAQSPLQHGTVYSNLGYWNTNNNGQTTPTYAYGPVTSSHNSYSTAPTLSNPVPYSARTLYSPARERPISPSVNDTSPVQTHTSGSYESTSYPSSLSMVTQGQVVTSNLSYGSPYNYSSQHPSHLQQSPISAGHQNGLNSPHDTYSPASALPPPTPSQSYYSQQNSSYQYSNPHSSINGTSTTSPRSNSMSQMHPPSLHSTSSYPVNHHQGSRYHVNMPNIYSHHGASIMSNGISGHLGPNTMQSTHLHTTPHASHNVNQQQERPFKCDQCPQSFNRNHDLKRHKRIHLAVKPFPCPNCEKSFSRKDALKRHVLVKGCGNSSKSSNSNNNVSSTAISA